MEGYPFRTIERHWREHWERHGTYKVNLDADRKFYVLVMFSYPSEKKLHIGHWWNYGPTDSYARFKRMSGYNVFEPMGFDAFGLPAENYAIKHGVHPAITTRDSIGFIREQLQSIGAMYDWSKEIDTSRPEYYKWTQWLFLQLFKTGAAYRKQAPVNWCPNCQTVLANEQVLSDGRCERCSTLVTVRDLEQWFFKITDFADRLLDGLERIQWPEATKTMQRHWIGRSTGTEIQFRTDLSDHVIPCFTTRPDTLFGVTYLVLAPEHKLVRELTTPDQKGGVEAYIAHARQSTEIERLAADREKTGCFTGAWAINPATKKRIQIWISDYVLATYGTGAVMAVPAHDQRDFEFAAKYELPIQWVIKPVNPSDDLLRDRAFEEPGIMHDSGSFNGLSSAEGKAAITTWIESLQIGRSTVSYRLRDWLISRQRYWGAPIPMVHCSNCGLVPLPESDLPLLLPEDGVDFTPHGSSPLGSCESFIQTTCPNCAGPARRDPDTMDTFVCSSWYFLRYISAHEQERPFDIEKVNRWLPVDVYVGGPEHATGHLIYARYITKYLHSLGLLDFDEPFRKLVHQGIITHSGHRMSKSKGNVVNPDSFVEKFGADCFRLYLMFMGDYTVGGDWSDEGIIGIRRFQNRIWKLFEIWIPEIGGASKKPQQINSRLDYVRNYTIKEVTRDLDNFQFNTAVSRLMEFLNELSDYTTDKANVDTSFLKQCLNSFILMLSPLAPHMGEELWKDMGGSDSVFKQTWPIYDEQALKTDDVTVVIQINGKLVERISISKGTSQEALVELALKLQKVKRNTSGKEIRRIIHVQDRLLNIVI